MTCSYHESFCRDQQAFLCVSLKSNSSQAYTLAYKLHDESCMRKKLQGLMFGLSLFIPNETWQLHSILSFAEHLYLGRLQLRSILGVTDDLAWKVWGHPPRKHVRLTDLGDGFNVCILGDIFLPYQVPVQIPEEDCLLDRRDAQPGA